MESSKSESTVEAPLYIKFAGQKYVRLDHAIKASGVSAKDALEAAATLIQRYPAIRTTIAEQAAEDIRSLKKECMGDPTQTATTDDRYRAGQLAMMHRVALAVLQSNLSFDRELLAAIAGKILDLNVVDDPLRVVSNAE